MTVSSCRRLLWVAFYVFLELGMCFCYVDLVFVCNSCVFLGLCSSLNSTWVSFCLYTNFQPTYRNSALFNITYIFQNNPISPTQPLFPYLYIDCWNNLVHGFTNTYAFHTSPHPLHNTLFPAVSTGLFDALFEFFRPFSCMT